MIGLLHRQYDVAMEYAGWAPADSADPLIRGDLVGARLPRILLLDDVVVAGMHVNRWEEVIAPVQKLIRGRVRVDRDRLADLTVPVTDLLP